MFPVQVLPTPPRPAAWSHPVIACLILAGLLVITGSAGAGEPQPAEGNVQFLFIHHSCGGQLLAENGPRVGGERESGEHCIYVSHPNGGGLRAALEAQGFSVNEASYGSLVGQDTDICNWSAKFRDQMDRILHTRRQDELLPDGLANRVVAFKSCFPNNAFVGEGESPGDPEDCDLTIANAQAAYRSLLPHLAAHPEVLFVAFTAPPQAEPKPVGIKQKLKFAFGGKPDHAKLARRFNDWMVDPQAGWLGGYEGGNVVVFDYYDLLTDHGASDWSAYPSREGRDSHPNPQGTAAAAEAFVPFIQEALGRQAAPAGRS